MKARTQKGFTLIELMIVVAIIGILASIAVPQYQDYLSRSRWSDNLSQAASAKAAIGECIQANNGTIAAGSCDTIPNLIAAGFLPADYVTPSAATAKYLAAGASFTVAGGVIVMTGSNLASNCVVTLTPVIVPGQASVRWIGATTAPPAACNRTVTGIGT